MSEKVEKTLNWLAVVSGGMDSITMLHEHKDIIGHVVSFNYGSNHNKNEIKHIIADYFTNSLQHFGLYQLLILSLMFLSCKKDNLPPQITITYPAGGDIASGEVSIIIQAIDNTGIESLTVFVDDTKIAKLQGNSSKSEYIVRWNTYPYQDSTYHTIYALAWDKAGNKGISPSISVIVINNHVLWDKSFTLSNWYVMRTILIKMIH